MSNSTDIQHLTLQTAIAQHRREEDPDGDVTEGMSETSAHAFNMHDAVHLIFGCDTSLKGEIAAHVWMVLGTTAPVAEMHKAVANQEHKSALAGIGHDRLLITWLLMLPRLVGIWFNSTRMTRKIDYHRLDDLMARTVLDIRAAHHIRV